MVNLIPPQDLIKKSFAIYKDYVWTFAGIFAVNLISYLLFLPITLSALFIFSKEPSSNMPSYVVIIFFTLAWLAINFLIMSWSMASAMYAVKERAQTLPVPKLLKIGWAILPSYLWISLLAGVLILCGLILFIIPGIILMVWYAFALYAFIFEGIKGVDALQRSSMLVSGYFWPIFGRLAIIMAAFIIVPMLFTDVFSTIFTLFVLTPFSLVYIYLIYEDVKRVKST